MQAGQENHGLSLADLNVKTEIQVLYHFKLSRNLFIFDLFCQVLETCYNINHQPSRSGFHDLLHEGTLLHKLTPSSNITHQAAGAGLESGQTPSTKTRQSGMPVTMPSHANNLYVAVANILSLNPSANVQCSVGLLNHAETLGQEACSTK